MSFGSSGIERGSVVDVLHNKRVWLIHVIFNATLMAAFFYWLQIPDERGWHVAMTAITGVLIVFLTLWLHAATFNHFATAPGSGFRSAMRRVIPKLPAFLLWTLVFGGVLWVIGQLWSNNAQLGGWLRHLLPEFLRREVSPRSMISATSAVFWLAFYFVWPILFLPVAAQTATAGIRGLFSKRSWRPSELHFWIMYAICFFVGAYFPYKLAWMTPAKPTTLSAQTWSMILRLGFGYLLLVTGWILLCAAIGRLLGPEPINEELPNPVSLNSSAQKSVPAS